MDVFHQNASKYVFMGDATVSIAFKVNDKMILYYSVLLCHETKNREPLVNIEILTDFHDEQPIKNCLQQFNNSLQTRKEIRSQVQHHAHNFHMQHVIAHPQSNFLRFLITNLLKNALVILIKQLRKKHQLRN